MTKNNILRGLLIGSVVSIVIDLISIAINFSPPQSVGDWIFGMFLISLPTILVLSIKERGKKEA